MAKIRPLRQCPLCRSMSYRDLAFLAAHVREEKAEAGVKIVEEGKPTSGWVLLTKGRARVTLARNASAAIEIGPGEFFGEFSLVDGGQTRAVGVEALESCEYLRLHPMDYQELEERAPGVAAKLAQGVLESLAEKMAPTKKLVQELLLEKSPN